MSFLNVLVCADLYGEKVNLEVSLGRVSNIHDVMQAINRSFAKENDARRPKGHPYTTFHTETILLFDDTIRKWRELTQISCLSTFCQLYAFQSETLPYSDTVQRIPPPRPLLGLTGASTSAPYALPSGRIVYPPGGYHQELDIAKITAVYDDLDFDGNGWVTVNELRQEYYVRGITFTEEMMEWIFSIADRNGDGRISFEEFRDFARLFPNATETLYWRIQTEESTSIRETHEALKLQRRREAELREELQRTEEQRKILESRIRHEHELAREVDPRKKWIDAHEQELLELEYLVNHRRESLYEAEKKFAERATSFHASTDQYSY